VPEPEEISPTRWPSEAGIAPPEKLWRPVGCRNCTNTGFQGRMAVTEVMVVTEEIELLTLERAPASELRKVAIGQGMTTLRQDGLLKVTAGDTTLDEVIRVTV